MTDPDPNVSKYAPQTTALATALADGQGSDYLTVLATLGRLEVQVSMLLEWAAAQRLRTTIGPDESRVGGMLDDWLHDLGDTLAGE